MSTLPAATCDLDNLPDVTSAGYPVADSPAVVPGTRATITCNTGYEFPGALQPLVTPVPTLPPTTTQRIPTRKEILANKPSYPPQFTSGRPSGTINMKSQSMKLIRKQFQKVLRTVALSAQRAEEYGQMLAIGM